MSADTVRVIPLSELVTLYHKRDNKLLLFDFFMDEHCRRLLQETEGLKKVQVIVNKKFKIEYRKQTLEIVK